jgi:hypothetical protein
MAKRRQVGGTQEVFIQVSAKSLTGTERAIKAVEKAGGRILHAFPPAVLVADVPAGKVAGLVGVAGITAADTGAIGGKALKAADPQLSFAIGAWNDHVNAERRLRALGSLELNRAWDVGDRLPPDPPAEVLAQLQRREAKLAPQKALKALAPGAPNMSIPVLLGRIAVGLVFVDSTVQQFAITDQERSKVVSETVEGLNMLAGSSRAPTSSGSTISSVPGSRWPPMRSRPPIKITGRIYGAMRPWRRWAMPPPRTA